MHEYYKDTVTRKSKPFSRDKVNYTAILKDDPTTGTITQQL